MSKEVKTDEGLQEILDEFVLFRDSTPYSNEATELSLFLRQCGYEDAMDRLGLELMEYLAIYRKKHELKARIDENNRWRTMLALAPSDDLNVADMDDFNNRVSELKKELEEL